MFVVDQDIPEQIVSPLDKSFALCAVNLTADFLKNLIFIPPGYLEPLNDIKGLSYCPAFFPVDKFHLLFNSNKGN